MLSNYDLYLQNRIKLIKDVKRITGKDFGSRYPVIEDGDKLEDKRTLQIEELEKALNQLTQAYLR